MIISEKVRNQFISQISLGLPVIFAQTPGVSDGEYQNFLSCIESEQKELFDVWFSSCIGSLFYKPNNFILNLTSEKYDSFLIDDFMFNILPTKEMFSSSCKIDNEYLYEKIICKVDTSSLSSLRNAIKLSREDGFIIDDQFPPVCTKRLCSFFSTENPAKSSYEHKHFLKIKIDYIDFNKYLNINKLNLWNDIYCKFRPENAENFVFENPFQSSLDKLTIELLKNDKEENSLS